MTPTTRRHLLIGAGALVAVAGSGYAWQRSKGSVADYAAEAAAQRAPLKAEPALIEIVRHAALAANGHNTQPWRFRVGDERIDIAADLSRRTPVVDPDDHHLYVSLGCAAENLVLAAGASGRSCTPAEPGDGAALAFAFAPSTILADPLFAAIPARQSTRAPYDGRAVPVADLDLLQKAGSRPGVTLVLVTDRGEIGRLRDLIVAGNDRQMRDPAFLAELKHWLRFSAREAMSAGDGLFAGASGNPVLPEAVGRVAFDLFVTAGSENERYARQIDSSAGLAAFFGDRADLAHWIEVGRACQRFALEATSLGLKHAFVNQPVEVAALRGELAALLGMPGRRPDLLLRFGYGSAMPYSLRRPVSAVLA